MSSGGRPEKPVDCTVPACARLADFLRARRAEADLTYAQMAVAHGFLSKATFERAASGAVVPSKDTVDAFVTVTMTRKEEELAGRLRIALVRGRDLLIRARRATRAPYYLHKAPDPTLIGGKGHLLETLRDQHVWAGCPTPGEMERMAGIGHLPRSTTRRVIERRSLPVTPGQAIAFLRACEVVEDADLELWLKAGADALERDGDPRAHEWATAHAELRARTSESKNLKSAA